jgi:triosephosphate isomerase
MRRKLVVGNWKMNFTLAEAKACIQAFSKAIAPYTSVQVGIAPTNLVLSALKQEAGETGIMIGGQDVFWRDKGAFTGRVSAPQLKDAGAEFCIIGHSETRGRFGVLDVLASTVPHFSETDLTVNLKLKALLYAGLVPIVCVGETHAEREAGETEAVISRQLAGALEGLDVVELNEIVVAYEPVWAIGTGNVCDAEEANRVCGMLRAELARQLDTELAERTRILYGGSVKSSNAKALFSHEHVDGGLVGGASLDAHEFAQIVLAAAGS